MARKPKPPAGKSVEALRHEEATRRNIPTAEYQSVIQKEAEQPAELSVSLLDDEVKIVRDRVPVGTMHLSKGLEFRAVAVMAFEEVHDTERHLLYVACTRARDHLLVTGVSPASEFLQDLGRHLPGSP